MEKECITTIDLMETKLEKEEKEEEEHNEYHFDGKRPVSSTIETQMGMSIWEYCGCSSLQWYWNY